MPPARASGGSRDRSAIVTWSGDWQCECGKTNKLWTAVDADRSHHAGMNDWIDFQAFFVCCLISSPPSDLIIYFFNPSICRENVRGNCTLSKCRFPHPPFKTPEHLSRPADPIANPSLPTKSTTHPTAVLAPADHADLDEMCIVSWLGHCYCHHCSKIHKLWDARNCGQVPPCREWVRGQCDLPKCRFPHPPFSIPVSLVKPVNEWIANHTPAQLALPGNLAASVSFFLAPLHW